MLICGEKGLLLLLPLPLILFLPLPVAKSQPVPACRGISENLPRLCRGSVAKDFVVALAVAFAVVVDLANCNTVHLTEME